MVFTKKETFILAIILAPMVLMAGIIMLRTPLQCIQPLQDLNLQLENHPQEKIEDILFNSHSHDESRHVEQDNPDLIAYIRKHHLYLPTQKKLNLMNYVIKDRSQNGQSLVLENIFQKKVGGKFLEVGAYDGEMASNTLYLERFLNWSGILIEGDPNNFDKVVSKNRNTININGCLSPEKYPMIVSYRQNKLIGQIETMSNASDIDDLVRVKCFPLYSMMLAAGLTSLDLLTLDVEGFELKVLKTIPWNKVRIDVLCVEYAHIQEGGGALKGFLSGKGYTFKSKLKADYFFVKNSSIT